MFGSIGRVFNSLIEAPYVGDFVQWIGQVQIGAIERWLPVVVHEIACHDSNTVEGKCQKSAIAVCGFCRHPVCLNHAMVGRTAEVVCLKCIFNALGKKTEAPKPSQAREPEKNKKIDLVKLHLKTLGLRSNSTLEQLQYKFRNLAKKHHPDKGGSKEEFQKISQAYHWLIDHHFKAVA